MGKPGSDSITVREHEDFARVYDLPDPRPYYRALRPLDYRMPAVACGYLEQHAARIASARGPGRDGARLRLLDFACGYAANGALLLHELSLDELYAFYGSDAPDDPGGDPTTHDARFFTARRSADPAFEVGGLDVAATALAYARDCGLLHEAFAENLLESPPSTSLKAFLDSTDIVLETGGIGDLLAPCFARLLDAAGGTPGSRRPWFLYSPRGNVDEAPLRQLFAERGYRLETCSEEPFRYRRLMSAREEAEVTAAARRYGKDPAAHFHDGWFINPLRLARPKEDSAALPVSEIMLKHQ
ncbi:MAG: hypothetical protein ACFCUQ_06705 [Kiloniellales bacterium]